MPAAAVFGADREREGAYDFLESEHVAPEEILGSLAQAFGAVVVRVACS